MKEGVLLLGIWILLVSLTDLTATGIFTAIQNVIKKYSLEISNHLAFVSDTCNVMKGVRNGVIAKFREVQPKIIDIHCICHLANLCVMSAVKVIPVKVDEFLVDIFYHFHNSLKSRESLKEYAEFC